MDQEQKKEEEKLFAKKLWSNVKFLCEWEKITTYKLEKELGLSKGYFNTVMNNSSLPNYYIVYRIASYFSVPADMITNEDFYKEGFHLGSRYYFIRSQMLYKLIVGTASGKYEWSMTDKKDIEEAFAYNNKPGSPNSAAEKEFDNHGYPMLRFESKFIQEKNSTERGNSTSGHSLEGPVNIGTAFYHSYDADDNYYYNAAIQTGQEFTDNWFQMKYGDNRFMVCRLWDYRISGYQDEQPVWKRRERLEIYMEVGDTFFTVGSLDFNNDKIHELTRRLYNMLETNAKEERLPKGLRDEAEAFVNGPL